MRLLPSLFSLTLLASTLTAQTASRPEPVGTVTGHVLCADTQRPARIAKVKLLRVPNLADLHLDQKGGEIASEISDTGDAVETSLDGSFRLQNVKQGTYYVIVDLPGYLLPLAQFSRKELAATDAETRARVARIVTPITINAGQTVDQNIVLERGASISGTVSYDDGTPANGLSIEILAKDDKGKWVPLENHYGRFFPVSTDDFGHYRVAGLPAGTYAVEADLSLSEHKVSFGPMPNNPGTMIQFDRQTVRFALPVFSGDVFRRADATEVRLAIGELRAGTDLVFPLAKLHRVSGQVIAKDAHVINDGIVHLLNADDRSELTQAPILYDDQAYHLEFVPEGSFVLKATALKDVSHVQVENTPGYLPRYHDESRTLRTFSDAEQPVIVQGDMSDVLITLGDAKTAK